MAGDRSLQRGLARVAASQIVTAGCLAVVAMVLASGPLRDDVLGGLVVVLMAMLIGFVPLRVFLRAGPDNIVAGWVASMILRMAATLIGLILLLTRYRLDEAACVWTVCGSYLLLLAVETIGMTRLMRTTFDRREELRQADLRREGETGDR